MVLAVMAMTQVAFAQAQLSSPLSPCRPEEIIGVWVITGLKANYAYDKGDQWYSQYQAVIFEAGGKHVLYTSNKPLTREGLQLMLGAAPRTQTYQFEGKPGQLSTYNPGIKQRMEYMESHPPCYSSDVCFSVDNDNGKGTVEITCTKGSDTGRTKKYFITVKVSGVPMVAPCSEKVFTVIQ
jgi:hypothetical protein